MADCLIAGIVLTVGGTLLTRNRREFERVAGLRLESHKRQPQSAGMKGPGRGFPPFR